MTLLDEHVERFNTAVSSGDFAPMLEQEARFLERTAA